jgi:alanine-alpha-ketoisovalerate/valine-pyruvate aminotransferase
MRGNVQVIEGDYRYHERLGNFYRKVGDLIPLVPLVIALPFPSTGNIHTQMKEILDECLDKNIPVHIDGAWITCCRSINFDFNHPAIRSVSISLSKGLGLGWNRVGLRWTRETSADAITIMNDFNMNLRAPTMIGLYFLRNLEPDYLWNTYGNIYYQVCADFSLTPTNSIYLAMQEGSPVGVSPLIRYLHESN